MAKSTKNIEYFDEKQLFRLYMGPFLLLLKEASNLTKIGSVIVYLSNLITNRKITACDIDDGAISKFISGEKESGKNMPFNINNSKDAIYIKDFDERVKNQYIDVLLKFNNFVNIALDIKDKPKISALIKRLYKLIELDTEINDDTLFFTEKNGKPITKKMLLKNREVTLQPFLLGIFHYILMHRPNDDRCDMAYNTITTQKKSYGTRNYNNKLDNNMRFRIHILNKTKNEDDNNTSNDEIIYEDIGYKEEIKAINNEREIYDNGMIHNLLPALGILKDRLEDINNFIYGTKDEDLTKSTIKPYDNELIDTVENYIDTEIAKYEVVQTNELSVVPKNTKLEDVFIENIYSKIPEDLSQSDKDSGTFAFCNSAKQNIENDIIKSKNNILLIASGGVGKSTYLQYIMLQILKHYNEYHLLPLFFEAKRYEKEAIKSSIKFLNGIKNNNDNLVLIIDALDEAPNDEKINIFNEIDEIITNNKIKFITSCRSVELTTRILHHFDVFHLYLFSLEQVNQYVDKISCINKVDNYFSNDKVGLNELLNEGESLIRTPLFLLLTIKIIQKKGKLPKNKIEIFDNIYDLMYEQYDEKIKGIPYRTKTSLKFENMKKLISGIAYYCNDFFKKSTLELYKNDIFKDSGIFANVDINEIVDDLTIYIPYLRNYENKSTDSIEENFTFIYTTLFEYFNANYYFYHLEKLETDFNTKFIMLEKYIEDYQVLPFLCQMLNEKRPDLNVEKVVIKPALKAILTHWKDLESYVIAHYGNIYLWVDEKYKDFDNRSEFYLTDFVLFYYKIKHPEINNKNLPFDNNGTPLFNMIYDTPIINVNLIHEQNILNDPIERYYTDSDNSKPTRYDIDVYKVLEDKKTYRTLYNLIFSNNSDFYKEYEFLNNKYNELCNKYN